jgi:UDP-N-acetylmuramoylalanine--D-glutamate ligase
MELEELKDKKILILGYGIEGRATQAFLRNVYPTMKVGLADQKDGLHYLEKQKEYDIVIKSPGIPKELVTIPYTTATNMFFANVKGITIGVTGSKGKSTTASLIYAILKEAGLKTRLAGNIGNPLLSELMLANNTDDIFVCELSSFQLSDIEYSPHISVILNLYPEHMDYHRSIDLYYDAKKNIVDNAKPQDYFIYNTSFEELKKTKGKTKAKSIPFIEKLPFDASVVPLAGKHNLDNVKAAVTVAQVLRIEKNAIVNGIKNFKGLPHRLELIGTLRGITFYDDAIATIPQATIAAIDALGNIGTVFLGGQDRGYDFSELADVILSKKIPNLVLFPESGFQILDEIKAKTSTLPKILETKNMEEAVKFAFENTPMGSICLLSCASPSFSVWRNFEEKGELFQKFVKKYGA